MLSLVISKPPRAYSPDGRPGDSLAAMVARHLRLVLFALLAALTWPAPAPVAKAAGPAAKPYKSYVSCRSGGSGADPFCFKGDRPVAVLRAFGRARLTYDLCVRRPGGRRECRERVTGRPGRRSRVQIEIGGAGRYKLVWFAGGRAVDRDALVVRERAVFVNGDSLGEGTRPYLPGALRDWRVSQSVSISRHAPEGVGILRRRGSLPGAIVVSLGTNDDPRAVDAFRNAVEATLEVAGRTRCVVWANIVRPPVGGAGYGSLNQVLAEEARRHSNLRVVDWVGLVRRNRGWLASDGVHVSAAGYQARARAIAEQVRRC
jgi:hypothetical protein